MRMLRGICETTRLDSIRFEYYINGNLGFVSIIWNNERL